MSGFTIIYPSRHLFSSNRATFHILESLMFYLDVCYYRLASSAAVWELNSRSWEKVLLLYVN